MRLRLLQRGLRDRSSSVQQAAATLAAEWLAACGGVVQLLQHLNLPDNPGAVCVCNHVDVVVAAVNVQHHG